MNLRLIKVFLFTGSALLLTRCNPYPEFPQGHVTGYYPVYATSPSVVKISKLPVHEPGKITRYKNYLLIEEHGTGVHIFDNTDPTQPEAVAFFEASRNESLIVHNNLLVMDLNNDLAVLNLDALPEVQVLSQQEIWKIVVPPHQGYYFQCVDSTRQVVDWVMADLYNPKCYR